VKVDIDAIWQRFDKAQKEIFDISHDCKFSAENDLVIAEFFNDIPALLDRIANLETVAEAARSIVKNHKGEIITWSLRQALQKLDGDSK
jgi:hypothetical protein